MKKKLLFLIHALNLGGGQKVLLELVNNIDFSQYDVTVQTIYDRGELRQQLNPSIRYRTILKEENKYVNALKSYFIRRVAEPEWSYKHFIEDDYDYAVAFLEGECTRLISGCSNPKTQLIAWVHIDFMNLFDANGVYKSTEEHIATYMKYKRIVCVSQGVAIGFCERFQRDFGDRIVVKYNVIDGEKIEIAAKENSTLDGTDGALEIISVGNMRQQKAYDRLLRVCDRLHRDGLVFHLTIVGGGSEYEKIKKMQEQLELDNVVTLLGNQPNPYKYMTNADLFLLASYAEGFSTVLIESIILGVPALVTQCSGMDEILDSGRYGIIIPNDEESIYQYLKSIIQEPSQLQKYKDLLPERKVFFDKKHAVQEIMQLFDD